MGFRLYHGTTLEKAKLIERDGLIPKAEYAFQISRPMHYLKLMNALGIDHDGDKLRDIEKAGVNVYVTDDPFRALYFAEFRASYERADEGAVLSYNLVKLDKVKNPSAEPAVVELTVPHEIWSKLREDPHAADAWIYRGAIPAKYVTAVKPVPYFQLDQDRPMVQIEMLKHAMMEKVAGEGVAA